LGYGQLGRGRGRGCGGGERGGGGKGRDHHVIDVAHLAQEPATPRLTTVARSFELRAHVYVSFAHASGHTHCERFVRDIGRFVAVVKVYWLARVARSAPAAPVCVCVGDRVADFSQLHGGPGGWGLGLGRYAQSTRGRDGRQTAERSQVRGFRRLRAWALASCDAGKPGLPAVRVRPQRERKPRSAARLSDGRACSGLAHPPWSLAPPGRPWPGRPGLCLSPQGAWGVLYGT
jgi:hypothetical protein